MGAGALKVVSMLQRKANLTEGEQHVCGMVSGSTDE